MEPSGYRKINYKRSYCNQIISQRVPMMSFRKQRYSINFSCFFMKVFFNCLTVNIMQGASSPNRTLDLASALEVGPAGSRVSGDHSGNCGSIRSVMTIAFQFAFESHLQENVASMARQYVRSIISSVQRVALALSPFRLSSHAGLRPPPGTPEAHTLARWICHSYRCDT